MDEKPSHRALGDLPEASPAVGFRKGCAPFHRLAGSRAASLCKVRVLLRVHEGPGYRLWVQEGDVQGPCWGLAGLQS